MSKIRILPDRVANQIAAGEVIERPAAVVKELLENSLDAGARNIEVEFRNGGRSLIRVVDDGGGMSADDALTCLERHATSKIAEASDLQRIATFGFRGEALPSIASVSRFLLQTRTDDVEHGTEVLVNAGKLIHVRECGMPVGTRIEVGRLFAPVPARRKFLKTDATESAHIIQATRLQAVAHPKVAFRTIENGRTVFQSPACPTLEDRLREVFGRGIAGDLLPIEARDGDMALSGFIGKPAAGRATRHEMITFVNQRPVDSRTLAYALLESYHESMPKGRYPVAFLYLEINPAGVDVNVHPAKREVRFHEEGRVRRFVIEAVRARLREERKVAFAGADPGRSEPASRPPEAPRVVSSAVPRNTGTTAAHIESPERARSDQSPGSPEEAESVAPQMQDAPVSSKDAGGRESRSTDFSWRYVGEASDGLALFETGAGLVVMDCRAAHERLLFEEIVSQFEKGSPPRQALLFPVPVELEPVSAAMLEEHLDFLKNHGFEIAPFGRNFFRIEGAPAWLDPGRCEEFVRDLVALMRERGLPRDRLDVAREQIARLAARQAAQSTVAKGMRATTDLARRLLACTNPLTSPQGRATFFEIGRGEIDRRLGK